MKLRIEGFLRFKNAKGDMNEFAHHGTDNNLGRMADFTLTELTEILVKHQELHEGLYNLSLEFQLAFGAVGPKPELIYPGAMIGVSRIGLSKTEEEKANIHTVDASKVNPAPKKRARKSKT